MIAALFVETNGCYFNQPGIDPWDIKRDACLYAGPHPVIAHPPCQRCLHNQWNECARCTIQERDDLRARVAEMEGALRTVRMCESIKGARIVVDEILHP